jgi:hypothetical protein
MIDDDVSWSVVRDLNGQRSCLKPQSQVYTYRPLGVIVLRVCVGRFALWGAVSSTVHALMPTHSLRSRLASSARKHSTKSHCACCAIPRGGW